jgi:hypothetical protein
LEFILPLVLNWYPETRLVYQEVSGYLSLEEIVLADRQLLTILDSVEAGSVHILVNSQQLQGIRPGILTLLQEIRSVRHSHLGCIISMGSRPKPILRHLTVTFVKTTGMVSDLKEALQVLEKLGVNHIDNFKFGRTSPYDHV